MEKKSNLKTIGFLWLVLTFFLFLGFFVLEGLGQISSEYSYNIGVGIIGLIVIGIVYESTSIDKNMNEKSAVILRVLFVVLSACIICSGLIWIGLGVSRYSVMVKPLSALYAVLATVEAMLFFYYAQAHFDVKPSKYSGPAILLSILALADLIFSLYFIFAPELPADSGLALIFGYLPGSSVLRIIMSLCARSMVVWIALDQPISKKAKIVFLICPIVPLIVGIGELFIPGITVFDTISVLGLMVVYNQIAIKRGADLAQKEAELTDQKVNLMISQIQPHFIFNALNTICYLCRKDPKAAEKATSKFAAYLRTNIDSLSKNGLVPFNREMTHVKTYVELEQMRFSEKLEVIYDLQYTDFQIPQLSLQPLVENAVKHGICEKENGGIVKISSAREDDFIVVKILDNGVGFDQGAQNPKEEDRVHVGISNVAGRIEKMCEGTLEVYSIPGTGTLATIRIPVKE